MGTSSSNKGPKSTSPLVPPWADANPTTPLPAPEGQRFRGFRTEFGRAAGGGGVPALRSAIGRYAREATHGSAIGPRRFGPAYNAGAGLADALNDLGSGGTGQDATGVDLSDAVGQPLDVIARFASSSVANLPLILPWFLPGTYRKGIRASRSSLQQGSEPDMRAGRSLRA